MKLSTEQEAVIESVKAGKNLLITGSAGTGKSTLLRALCEIDKNLEVTASTGIAAVNVGGMTIHSWAGLGLATETAEQIATKLKDRRSPALARIKETQRLAIDEVSMIHGDLFDLIDQLFRIIRDNHFQPFGGMQVITWGDFLQLPPVSREKEQKFAFQSQAWGEASIKTALLTKVFRQSDERFSAALNKIRYGTLTEEVKTLLRSRYRAPDPNPEIEPVVVYTHNMDVDVFNERRLKETKGELQEYTSHDTGKNENMLEVIRKNCLAPQFLRLKIGAQVMLLKNIDPMAGLANGSIGIVTSFSKIGDKTPYVKFACGATIAIEPHTWKIKVGRETVASRTQLPLRLAWAITCHKSQGMTLDKIKVHLENVFEAGQAYVALSRARTLDGLFIQNSSPGCIRAHPDAVKFYEMAERII